MFLQKYHHKIKTPEELQEILGSFPREKKAVMCHGVFDVVHPGHIRHLSFAKNKADILVASLTADRHINKGKHRPHVPQALRAENLAAFEMVDYVVIDKNAAPLELISKLQPDFFAKGYEYVADGMPTKTLEEENLLSAYGGKILFTPGDVVYSSSALINTAEPSIRYEKLAATMSTFKVNFQDLYTTLEKMKGLRVHVVGDTIVDGFTKTTMIGGQTKTPTVSVRYESQDNYVGGAGVVAKHLRSAGAQVTLSTLLGSDQLKDFVLSDLQEAGVTVNAVVDERRPTTHKNAIIAGGYRLLKVDTLDNSSIDTNILDRFVRYIQETECDAIIFSDFRHGIFNKNTIPTLKKAIPERCFKAADSQVASRWGNITEFKGFDLITPNEREARFALGDQDTGVRPLAAMLYDATACETMILTLGEKGVLTCCNSNHESLDSFVVLDSFVNHLKDPVGSGDALLAYATMALTAGAGPIIASILGTLAAACACEHDGNVSIEEAELMSKIKNVKERLMFIGGKESLEREEVVEAK